MTCIVRSSDTISKRDIYPDYAASEKKDAPLVNIISLCQKIIVPLVSFVGKSSPRIIVSTYLIQQPGVMNGPQRLLLG